MKVGDVVTVDGYPHRIPGRVAAIDGNLVRVALPLMEDPDRTIPYSIDEVRPMLALVPTPPISPAQEKP